MLEVFCYVFSFALLVLAAIPAVPRRDTLLAAGIALFVLPACVHALQAAH